MVRGEILPGHHYRLGIGSREEQHAIWTHETDWNIGGGSDARWRRSGHALGARATLAAGVVNVSGGQAAKSAPISWEGRS